MKGTVRPGAARGKPRRREANRAGEPRADWRRGLSAADAASVLGIDETRVRILSDRAARKFCGRLLRQVLTDPPEGVDPMSVLAEAMLDPATAVLLGADAAAEHSEL